MLVACYPHLAPEGFSELDEFYDELEVRGRWSLWLGPASTPGSGSIPNASTAGPGPSNALSWHADRYGLALGLEEPQESLTVFVANWRKRAPKEAAPALLV